MIENETLRRLVAYAGMLGFLACTLVGLHYIDYKEPVFFGFTYSGECFLTAGFGALVYLLYYPRA